MKAHLFILLTLFIGLTLSSQTNSGGLKPSGKLNLTETFVKQLKWKENSVQSPNSFLGDSSLFSKEATSNTSFNWNLLCGSMNVYGMLINQTRPLQYNPTLNVVSFIHRKSATYNPYPVANGSPGTIVAEISSNWGQTWDSTCIWADATNGGRYPQGAIYSSLGNTNIANAYVVGCGPVVSNNAFTGDWYASKPLGVPATAAYNPTPSTVSGGQQFISFTQTVYPVNQAPHGWSMQGFTAIQGGVVRSMALIDDDNTDANTMRGAMIVKGTFNAGVFVWTTDSLVPNVVSQITGNRQFSTKVQMAWNQLGTIGYAVIIGALNSSQGSNRGLQPIIYKTTNSGQSWSLLNGINFNNSAYASILSPLGGVESDANLKIPFVDDFDLTVDKNNYLHIGAILGSTFSDIDDSLQFISQFTTSINPNDEYKWKHIPGKRPYLYDFYGDGSQAWKYWLIDSLSSEGPGTLAGSSGFSENPWDVDANQKIQIDSRLQLGRTPDGEYLTFSWAETDTAFIPQSKKWNIQPNIKVRCLKVDYQQAGSFLQSPILPQEYNITKPNVGQGTQHPKVVNRATLHFMSPLASNANTIASSTLCRTVDITIPFSVTNSQPYSQLTNNSTWYTSTSLTFTFCNQVDNINEKQIALEKQILFPNPTKNFTHLKFDAANNMQGELKVLDLLGAAVSTKKVEIVIGENNIEIDLKNLPSGIYFVNLNLGEQSFTKKLVIE